MSVNLRTRPVAHKGFIARNGKAFGRLPAPDVNDFGYRFGAVRGQLRPAGPLSATAKNWRIDWSRLPVDQGPTPRCVGYSHVTALIVGPNTFTKNILTTDDANHLADVIYRKALGLDEWDGEDPDSGTSVRAGMKAGQAEGYIKSYAWGESVDDAAFFVLHHGPAVAGTVWPDSMMDTDAHGYLVVAPDSTLDGPNAAGHAYCLAQVDTLHRNPDGTVGRFTIPQTWGTGWGWHGKGEAFISFQTFAQLFMAGGEVCFPLENKIVRA